MKKDVGIRIYHRDRASGIISDGSEDYDLASFAGVIPSIGDVILRPGVMSGLDRRERANRIMWEVVARYFNPRDTDNIVALVIEERTAREEERDLV